MNPSKISFTIEYAGLQVQVVRNEKGEDVTPLKPISDLFGLQWERQRKKVTEPEFRAFLGTCTVPRYGAGSQKREETCILLSRVAVYLLTLSAGQIRGQGNEDGAKFLAAKQQEWADALHDYEQLGAAFNLNHAKVQEVANRGYMRLAQLVGIKARTENPKDRAVISQVIARMAGDMGFTYQPDLLDGTPSSQ